MGKCGVFIEILHVIKCFLTELAMNCLEFGMSRSNVNGEFLSCLKKVTAYITRIPSWFTMHGAEMDC